MESVPGCGDCKDEGPEKEARHTKDEDPPEEAEEHKVRRDVCPPPHEDGPDGQLGKEGDHQVPDEEDEEEPPQIPDGK